MLHEFKMMHNDLERFGHFHCKGAYRAHLKSELELFAKKIKTVLAKSAILDY